MTTPSDNLLERVARAICASANRHGQPDPDRPLDFGWGEWREEARASIEAMSEASELHGLDTPERVCFYEQDFYVLSNFSSFAVEWSGFLFSTSEHLYHWLRFTLSEDSFGPEIARKVFTARSAHDAFKIAQENKRFQVANWNEAKVSFMRRILREKANQHEYVRRKLLATGDRELVENSWRDDYWGWGPNRDGQNMLGKLWMEVRDELRVKALSTHPDKGGE